MPLWTANDDPTGRPNYANNATVYGVDKTEAAVTGNTLGPGWVNVTKGTGYVTFSVVNGGSGYANADVITVDGGANPATTNATANIVVGESANLTGTLAITSGNVNVTATGANLLSTFANSEQLFVYSNSSNMIVKTINKVVNSSFMNVTSTFAVTNAAVNYGKAGVIKFITNPVVGSGFTTTYNVAISGTGLGANVVSGLGGRAGRTTYEHMVVVKNMTGDASDDTVLPDA